MNHGDIKASQGNTAHVQSDMITQVYAHIPDEDRKVNAQRFEAGFYAKPNLRGVEQSPASRKRTTAGFGCGAIAAATAGKS